MRRHLKTAFTVLIGLAFVGFLATLAARATGVMDEDLAATLFVVIAVLGSASTAARTAVARPRRDD